MNYPNRNRQPLRPFESPHCRVYVIELDPSVTEEPLFRKANPHYQQGKPCFYVGMTSLLDVKERFLQHVGGGRNSSRLAGYGQRLRMDLVPNQTPVRRTWALQAERRLARALRVGGVGVWQA